MGRRPGLTKQGRALQRRALRLRLNGLTLEMIGRRLGVSRQRVQQLLAPYPMQPRYDLLEKKGDQR